MVNDVLPELQKVNTDVFINLRDRTEHIIVSANRGDMHSRTIRFHFTHEGELYELPEGTVARFLGTRPDGAGIIEELPCTVSGNQVLYEMTPYVLNIPGDVRAKIELRNDETEQILTTVSFLIHIPPDPFDENTIIQTDEFSVLNQLITTIEKAVEDVNEALVQVEQTVEEANQAIQVIYDTNEKMQVVISDAQTVIGDMEQKLLETDEKVGKWQTDIETAITNAEQAVADTISKAEQAFEETIEDANQAFTDTLSQAQTDINSMISDAEQSVSDLISQVETAISQAGEAADQANQAAADADQATSAANQATAAAASATEQAEEATERAIAAARAAEEAAAKELPIATTTILGAVKAGEQIAVAEDGTMSIASVPFEALPEETKLYSPFIIQAEEPPGDPKRAWINSATHVMSYYDGTAWVKLASIWS